MASTIVRDRHHESLHHALGPLIADALARPDVVEIMANPDGSLWVDRAGVGREKIGRIESTAAGSSSDLIRWGFEHDGRARYIGRNGGQLGRPT